MATPQEVVTLWAKVSGVDPERYLQIMGGTVEVQRLCGHSLDALAEAAHATARPNAHPTVRLSIGRWLIALEGSTPAPSPAKAHARRPRYVRDALPLLHPDALRELIAHAERTNQNGDLTRTDDISFNGFNDAVVEEAVERLRARGLDQIHTGRAIRQPPHWGRPPSTSLVGAPELIADPVETAIVAILSHKSGEWMFVSSPNGRMFTHARSGVSVEADRFYVDGLSRFVDAASGLIESHRAGLGGRVYLRPRYIQCAECHNVMAWLGPAGTQQIAFRVCEGVSVRHR